MAKRYKTLKQALKLLRPLGGGAVTDLADSSALGYFQAVQAGKKEVSYTRAESSNPGPLIIYALIPFATPVTGAAHAQVTMSKRSEQHLAGEGISATTLNIDKTANVVKTAVDIAHFRPARAHVFVSASGTTTPVSKVTGRKYTKNNGATYSYPFGSKPSDTTLAYYAGVKEAIVTALNDSVGSVSFSPEQYR